MSCLHPVRNRTALSETRSLTRPPVEAHGWPPIGYRGRPYPVRPLAGYIAHSGSPLFKPTLVIMYGLRGSHLGGYAVAGIQIAYVTGGHAYTVSIYNGADMWYYPRGKTFAWFDHHDGAAHNRYDNLTATAVQQLAAQHGA